MTKLKVATENLTFDAATKDPNFNVHTIYLVPGSLTQDSDNGQDQPKLCLMFTSFNLILNVARAVYWYRDSGGAIAGIDHTFFFLTTLLKLICTTLLRMMYLKKKLVGKWYKKGSGSGEVVDEGVR